MSKVYHIGSTWKGFHSIKRLIIFGDSYSSVHSVNHDAKKANAADPLGLPFPGTGIWNEDDEPNWVGHLITKFRPGPRYTPNEPGMPGKLSDQDEAWIEDPLLVHNYARGGDNVQGVKRQIERVFLPGLGKNTELKWTAEEALFVTWVGINDCAFVAKDDIMVDLFGLQDRLYEAGARNFVLIDLPPIHRTPAGIEYQTATNFEKWNADLRQSIELFVSTHEDTSVFLYSSFTRFNSLLDDPAAFGFKREDVKQRDGTIWVDHLHPTSLVHEHIASDIASFLAGIAPVDPGENGLS